MPSSPSARPEPSWLSERPFAHRGLHGGGVCENSRSAFLAAVAQDVGIELDVRLSRDGFAVVFHDAELGRLIGATGPVAGLTAAELGRLKLAGGDDRIESLAAVLTLVAGRVPLLIELKTDGDKRVAARLCLSVRHALEGYRGHAAVMSFDPAVGAWFARHAPRTVRGLVVGESIRPRWKGYLRRLLTLRTAKPHFLACDIRSLPSRTARGARQGGLPVLAWTVRTEDEQAHADAHADEIIFERA